MTGKDTRGLIVETADRLFYEAGFDHTSFADIAGQLGISRGNFYYHFKSKDEILDAVIALRLERTAAMLAAWAQGSDEPAGRIRSFIDMLVANRTKIMAHGCPVGTLCNELAKLDHGARSRAGAIFTLFRDWLGREFARFGRSADADALAMELLVRSQGVATLASAFRDEAFIRREVAQMHAWLEAQRPSPQPG
ncbi:TetR/AcrR family transcriptional regulator [Bosea sp. CS1GBMeth4]|uniref:TetR/AcrR family transcriptional regulator n=1 Tax=Bosea sp. CS1GBMeth4 TaxID=1892849 RepID=UPI001644AF82|nr:TetR/AcrR family transcriptional regulator [Bosea sp. CS1GBMeth4]